MAYRVELSPEADAEIEAAYRWVFDRSSRGANRWYNGLMVALGSLDRRPRRCPLAPETQAFDEEIRQLLYGRRQHRCRILFTICKQTVRVLHVRHDARRHLTAESDEFQADP